MSDDPQWLIDMRQRELDQFPIGAEVVVTLHGECPPGRLHGTQEIGARGIVLNNESEARAGHPIWVVFRHPLPAVGMSSFYTPGELRPFDMLTDLDWTPEERAALAEAGRGE